MRKIAANLVFDGFRFKRNAVVICDDSGVIVDVKPLQTSETPALEYYSGLLVPGFINMHQHMELAWMHGKIPPEGQLNQFIRNLIILRQSMPDHELVLQAMKTLDTLMYMQGVAVVVDIANSACSVPVKLSSKIKYITLVELYDMRNTEISDAFGLGLEILDSYRKQNLEAYITPHSFYSVSEKLLGKIVQHQALLQSIHFLESPDEVALLFQNQGALGSLIYGLGQSRKIDAMQISSILQMIQAILEQRKLILVHNTFIPGEVIEMINLLHVENLSYCLCPNSNLYISGALPDWNMLMDSTVSISIGSDSPASNFSLSFLDELKTIQNSSTSPGLETLLRWSTSNAAATLGLEKTYGSFSPGLKPGIVLISNIDTVNARLTESSYSKRLL